LSRAGGLWRLAGDVPDAGTADIVAAAFADECETVSIFEKDDAWRVEGLARDKPNLALIEALLLAALGEGAALSLDRVAPRDWLAENQASFPAIRVGRWFIHGSHDRVPVPAGRIEIVIDAATAFGTGEHATTRGCLLALDRIAKSGFQKKMVLDMGCGTGILGIAATRRLHRKVLACDIDPEAARVTRVNARRNQVAGWIEARTTAGYRGRDLRRRRPFDLVFANILARPLMVMAPELKRALAPGGVAILSGLLARQEAAVLAAHRAQGLFLVARIAVEGWHTLVVARRRLA
jgi:ribosomal protein L11 methyltransferase